MHSFLLLSRFSHAGLRPLALAVLGTLSVGTVYAAAGYDATHSWDDSDVPTVENGTISFASKDIRYRPEIRQSRSSCRPEGFGYH